MFLLKSWFDEIFWVQSNFFPTLWVKFSFVHTITIAIYYAPSLFWQKFRESNISTKQITKWLIWRNIYTARVNFSFTFRTNFLWNSFTNQQWIILMKRFHEIFPNKRGLCIRDSKMFKVWVSNKWLNHEWVTDAQCVKLWKFSLTLFWQKFRETNVFTNEVTRELISRNIFSVRNNFLFFHTCDIVASA